jgi:hypothetical protein
MEEDFVRFSFAIKNASECAAFAIGLLITGQERTEKERTEK